MARPMAVGLKYFPFDVDLLDNEALDILRDEYGMIVNSVYIGLLSFLYKKCGYFIPYETEKEKEECIWYIFKKVRGGKYPPSKETISQVIDACVARELFSRELYPKIITSKRAQAEFYSATVERKSVPISPDIWLMDIEDMAELSKKHPYYLEVTNQNKSDDKPSYSTDKQNKSDDKPLNKIKQDKTKSNEIKSDDLEVSKKEEINAYARESYDDIFDGCGITGSYRDAFWAFIQHCNMNKRVPTNDKIYDIIVRLDFAYQNDDSAKAEALKRAVRGGYFDVKENK